MGDVRSIVNTASIDVKSYMVSGAASPSVPMAGSN